jgi:recombination protein RecT
MATDLAQRAATAKPVDSPTRSNRDLVLAHGEELSKALGQETDVDHFIRGVLTVLTNSPQLQQASERSLMAAILFGAQLKLEIGNGMNQFHLTPRKRRWTEVVNGRDEWKEEWVCVPMIGYQGYVELSYRSAKVLDFQVVRIREGDAFEYRYTTETGKQLFWQPADNVVDESKPYKGGIIRSRLAGGGVAETYMTVGQIEQRRPDSSREQEIKFGKDKGNLYVPNTPWTASVSSYESMCDKTIMREHQKYLPKSIEMMQALALDGRLLARNQHGELEAAATYAEDFGPNVAALESGEPWAAVPDANS